MAEGLPLGARIRRPLCLILLAVAGGCGDRGTDLAPGTPVILISIDTLRSDRLPVYGYEGVDTPAIDALARESIVYEHAYSHVPLTLPSHASMLTGVLPPEHRVRDNLGYRFDPTGLPYLPRLLKAEGYATGAAVSSYVLRGATGIDADFDFYEDRIAIRSGLELGSLQRTGADTLEAALPWLRSVGERPFFLFFHLYEPHTPHQPAEPFATRYPDRPYDGEVAMADAVVGDLVTELERLGVYDRALVLLTSDHGEGLGEHGQLEHMVLIYREVLQVPLLVKLPGGERGGTRVERPVQLADLLPTVTGLLGLETPDGLVGTSLLAEEVAPRSVYSESHYPRLHFGWSELSSLIDERYHLIMGPDPELFDLRQDPAQTRNLVREERRTYGDMKQELERFDLAFRPPAEVDEEAREKLAALGYVGSVATGGDGPLADPKSKIHLMEVLAGARRLVAGGRHAEAVAALERVVAEEPLLVDAWETLAKSLHRLGFYPRSEAAFRKALELSSGAPHVALAAAELYLETGRLDEARSHAELATRGHDVAWDILAQVSLRQGDLAAAEGHAAKAVELRGSRVGPLVTQAEVRVAQKRFEEAVRLTEEAEREFGERADREVLRGLYLARGKAYAQSGEVAAAEAAFRAEIELSPTELSPYTHLAYLYALVGQAADAGSTLRSMVETNPHPEAYAAAVRTLREMGDPGSAAAVLARALSRWPESPELRRLRG